MPFNKIAGCSEYPGFPGCDVLEIDPDSIAADVAATAIFACRERDDGIEGYHYGRPVALCEYVV